MCSHNNIFFYSGITYTAESIILLFALALGKKKKKKICQDSFSVLQLRGNTMLFKHFIVTLYHDHICFFLI